MLEPAAVEVLAVVVDGEMGEALDELGIGQR